MSHGYLPCLLVVGLAACAAADEQQVTYRLEVLGGRTAVELSDLEVTPLPTRGGDVRFNGYRFLRRYEFDLPLEELARGTSVTIQSRRDGAAIDTQVLAPYLCVQIAESTNAATVVETHQVAIDAAGSLFVDYDIDFPLWYTCNTTLAGGGTGGGTPLSAQPTCADLPGFDTNVQILGSGLAPVESNDCSAYQHYWLDGTVEAMSVGFGGSLPDGRWLTMRFSVCATPADVPLERTVASVTGTACAREGLSATITGSPASYLTAMELAGTGTLALSAIDDSRDGWLEGSINVTLTSPSGERLDVVGPFRLSTIRM